MKFIDFFAGIGGIRLGLERAGHECVGFCEWDKFARQSYKAMHDTKGEWENHDIRTASSMELPKADLWTFGFPCQDLSIAGKRKGLQEGERSGLFYEIVRLLQGLRQEDRPKWLLAENVKGLFSAGRGFDFLRCIVELGGLGYDIEYQLLNSKDFGVPQNRERVFIIGHLGDGSGRKVFPIRPNDGENTDELQDQRKAIRLGNIYGPNKGTGYAGNVWDKTGLSPTLDTAQGGNRMPLILDNYEKIEPKVIDAIYNNREPRITEIAPTLRADRQGLCVGGDIRVLGSYNPSGYSSGRVVDVNGIAPTVMENHGTVTAVAIDLTENNPKVTDVARRLKARYNKGYSARSAECSGVLCVGNVNPSNKGMNGNVFDSTGLAPTLTTNKGEGNKILVAPVLTPDREEKRQNGRLMKEDGEPMFTLTAQDKHGVAIIDEQNKCFRKDGTVGTLTTDGSSPKHNNRVMFGGTRIRKLTPRECWRLQGFPDEYFDKAVAAGVSNSQLYKQAGNAVTVNVAEAIGRRLRDIELGWMSREEAEEWCSRGSCVPKTGLD